MTAEMIAAPRSSAFIDRRRYRGALLLVLSRMNYPG